MRHAGKRIVSSLCALALLAAMLPAPALANEPLPAAAVTVQQGTDEQQGSGDVVTGTESKQAAPEGEGENGNTPEAPSASSSQESGTSQPGDEEKAPENGGGDEEQTEPATPILLSDDATSNDSSSRVDEYVAQIDGQGYTTLDDIINAALASDEPVSVTVLKSCSLGVRIAVKAD